MTEFIPALCRVPGSFEGPPPRYDYAVLSRPFNSVVSTQSCYAPGSLVK